MLATLHTECLTCRLTDKFLSAFCGNCVTFHECQADISGQTNAKSTTGFAFVILMIWQQFNQYLWTWASQGKNKESQVFEMCCYQETKESCSFESKLESKFVKIFYIKMSFCDTVLWIVLRGKMSPQPCTITLSTNALSLNVRLICSQWSSSTFCLINIVQTLISLFLASEKPFPGHK